jgi:hypothetical protein
MKFTHILIASAALVAGPAVAQEAGVPQAGADCAALQAQWDQTVSTASAEQLSSVQPAADEGKRLCAEGKTAEGAAKLQEALSGVSKPSQMPAEPAPIEQPPTEQPPTDTEHPPQ